MILKSSSRWLLDPQPPGNEQGGGSGEGQQPQQQTPPSQLSPDQQKIAAALEKGAAAEGGDKKPATQPKIHKAIFTQPSQAVLEQEFGVDDGAPTEIKDEGVENKVEKPTTTTPPAKQQTTTAKQQPQQKVEPTTTPQKIDATQQRAFDYSQYSPEEAAVLKQMSNQAREFTVKTLKELRELREQKPAVYFQHEEGYLLDPQYKELNHTISFTEKEHQHWKQQLVNIRQGKPWQMLDGFDDKGNPILRGPFKATDEAEIDISNAMGMVGNQLAQMRQQQQGYGKQYQEQIKRDNAVLEAERANRFAWVGDPAKMEDKVDIGGKAGEVPIKQIRQDFKGLFARYHHGNPVLEMAADMFVALQIYGARIRELEGATQHERRIKEDALAGEPTIAEGGKVSTPDDKGEFNMEGLPS